MTTDQPQPSIISATAIITIIISSNISSCSCDTSSQGTPVSDPSLRLSLRASRRVDRQIATSASNLSSSRLQTYDGPAEILDKRNAAMTDSAFFHRFNSISSFCFDYSCAIKGYVMLFLQLSRCTETS